MNSEELKHRIKNAITLIEDGQSLKIGDLTLGCKDKNHLSIIGWTSTNNMDFMTEQSALNELIEIKTLFTKMTIASNELANFIIGKQIEYCLNYDSGKGSIEICKEINNNLTWKVDFKN